MGWGRERRSSDLDYPKRIGAISRTKNMHAVRPATLEDLMVVASWIRTPDECERWGGTQVPFPIDRVALPDTIGFTEQNAYVMIVGGSLIAFGQIFDKPQHRQHLAKFIVSPIHRGRGYGRKFLYDLLGRTTVDRVSLNVNQDNSAAIALYAAAGFVVADRPPDQGASARTRYMERKRNDAQ